MMNCDILTSAFDNNDTTTLDLLVSSGNYPLFKFVRIAETWIKSKLTAGVNLHQTDFFDFKLTMWDKNIVYSKRNDKINAGHQVQVHINYKLLWQGNKVNKSLIRRTMRSTNGLVKLLQTYGSLDYTLRTSLNYIYEQRYGRVI